MPSSSCPVGLVVPEDPGSPYNWMMSSTCAVNCHQPAMYTDEETEFMMKTQRNTLYASICAIVLMFIYWSWKVDKTKDLVLLYLSISLVLMIFLIGTYSVTDYHSFMCKDNSVPISYEDGVTPCNVQSFGLVYFFLCGAYSWTYQSIRIFRSVVLGSRAKYFTDGIPWLALALIFCLPLISVLLLWYSRSYGMAWFQFLCLFNTHNSNGSAYPFLIFYGPILLTVLISCVCMFSVIIKTVVLLSKNNWKFPTARLKELRLVSDDYSCALSENIGIGRAYINSAAWSPAGLTPSNQEVVYKQVYMHTKRGKEELNGGMFTGGAMVRNEFSFLDTEGNEDVTAAMGSHSLGVPKLRMDGLQRHPSHNPQNYDLSARSKPGELPTARLKLSEIANYQAKFSDLPTARGNGVDIPSARRHVESNPQGVSADLPSARGLSTAGVQLSARGLGTGVLPTTRAISGSEFSTARLLPSAETSPLLDAGIAANRAGFSDLPNANGRLDPPPSGGTNTNRYFEYPAVRNRGGSQSFVSTEGSVQTNTLPFPYSSANPSRTNSMQVSTQPGLESASLSTSRSMSLDGVPANMPINSSVGDAEVESNHTRLYTIRRMSTLISYSCFYFFVSATLLLTAYVIFSTKQMARESYVEWSHCSIANYDGSSNSWKNICGNHPSFRVPVSLRCYMSFCILGQPVTIFLIHIPEIVSALFSDCFFCNRLSIKRGKIRYRNKASVVVSTVVD